MSDEIRQTHDFRTIDYIDRCSEDYCERLLTLANEIQTSARYRANMLIYDAERQSKALTEAAEFLMYVKEKIGFGEPDDEIIDELIRCSLRPFPTRPV